MKIVNLTPHTVNVLNEGGGMCTISPSGQVARVSVKYFPTFQVVDTDASSVEEALKSVVQIYTTNYGAVEGLPEQQQGKLLLVSGMVRAALPDRMDLVSPGDLVRDDAGRPVGCKGLVGNFRD